MSSQLDHDFRKNGIGGSDAPAIMGVSPWKDEYDVWEEKVLPTKEDIDSIAMKYGREEEEPARREFEKLMGVMVAPQKIINPKDPWMRGNVDGLSYDGIVLVEIKNIFRNQADHDRAKYDKKVPDKYYPQLQHYMRVCRDAGHPIEGMYYFSRYRGDSVVLEVAYDDPYVQDMYLREKALWDLVLKKTPPARVVKEYRDMKSKEDWLATESEWAEVKAQLDEWEAKEKGLREQLISMSSGVSSQGIRVKLMKSEQPGAIDYKAAIRDYVEGLREKFPGLSIPDVPLESYRKDSFTKYTLKAI